MAEEEEVQEKLQVERPFLFSHRFAREPFERVAFSLQATAFRSPRSKPCNLLAQEVLDT